MFPIHGYASVNKLERDIARRDRRSRWERFRCWITAHPGIPYIDGGSDDRLWSCCGRRVLLP